MALRTLITGASGFVGRALMESLAGADGIVPVAGSRGAGADGCRTPELGPDADWSGALQGIDAIVHCAAYAHQAARGADALAEIRAINTDGTLALARQAARAGVRRFVFLSSVKVNGERSDGRRPFRESDPPAPEDAYGISKHEAEVGLRALADSGAMEVVILRPPLVYGPEPKANMARLLRWTRSGFPLPFGSVDNRRSLISSRNLASAATAALTHPTAAGRTYLVSDQEDVSTPELIRAIAEALGRRARLVPFPVAALRELARVAGLTHEMDRLTGSLTVDSSLIGEELGWSPVETLREGIAAMVRLTPSE